MTLAIVHSWMCIGMMNGALPVGDAAVESVEKTLRTVEASGKDYAVAMIKNGLGLRLLWRGEAADRDRALEMVAQVRDLCLHQRYPANGTCAQSTGLPRAKEPSVATGTVPSR